MNKEEMQNSINEILYADYHCGVTGYVCVKTDNGLQMKKLLMTDALRNKMIDIMKSVVTNKFLNDDIVLDSAENISDNRNVLYEICQSEDYKPFCFLDNDDEINELFIDADKKNIIGMAFKLNYNSKAFWTYQHIYPMQLIDKSRSVLAVIAKGSTYDVLKNDVLKIESKVDILIIGNSLITSNIKLLQNSFGFEKFIRKEAAETIQLIKQMDIVDNIEKIEIFEDKQKLTNAKKLMKAKISPVLKMDRKELIDQIKKHPRYKEKIKIKDNKIIVSSQKEANEFIKMLNDDIVRSELTNQEYDSSHKQPLLPMART